MHFPSRWRVLPLSKNNIIAFHNVSIHQFSSTPAVQLISNEWVPLWHGGNYFINLQLQSIRNKHGKVLRGSESKSSENICLKLTFRIEGEGTFSKYKMKHNVIWEHFHRKTVPKNMRIIHMKFLIFLWFCKKSKFCEETAKTK